MKSNFFFHGLCMALVAIPAFAQDSDAVKPTVKKLALFKNGYAYATLQVDTRKDQKHIKVMDMPFPALGTLWVQTNGDTSVKLLFGKRETVEQPKPNFSLLELAQANPGASISIQTKDEKISGTVSKMTLVKPDTTENQGEEVMPFLMIDTVSGGLSIIQGNDILGIHFNNAENLKQPTWKMPKPSLNILLDKAVPEDPVQITCVTHGITWIPSYKLELGENGKGKFIAKAEIINELSDIKNADLELISGFPSIQYPTIPAPISMLLTLAEFNNVMGNGGTLPRPMVAAGNIRSNALSMQAKASYEESFDVFSSMPSASPMGPGNTVKAEDLFFYPVNQFTCAKGETILANLFEGEVEYEHIMTWDVPEMQVIEQYARNSPNPGVDSPTDVWHCVRIKNGFEAPLTTATIQFSSKNRYIGQGTINFTPVGQKSLVRINKSMEVITDNKENVIGEEEITFERSKRLRSTTEGTLSLVNLSEKPMKVQITKRLNGTFVECSDEGKTTKSQFYYNGYNPQSTAKWEITVQPGEKKELTYKYTFIR